MRDMTVHVLTMVFAWTSLCLGYLIILVDLQCQLYENIVYFLESVRIFSIRER